MAKETDWNGDEVETGQCVMCGSDILMSDYLSDIRVCRPCGEVNDKSDDDGDDVGDDCGGDICSRCGGALPIGFGRSAPPGSFVCSECDDEGDSGGGGYEDEDEEDDD